MKRILLSLIVAFTLFATACTVKYSLSGASIPPDAKTFSVAYFPNNAPMVAPILSATLTDELTQRFASRTSLVQVEEGGDFAFEGEIVGYSSTTSSVSSGDYALQNRLTISIKVKFTNAIDDKMSFNRNFSAYADYDSTKLLTEVEGELIPQIVEQLVTDVFQAAASNW
ncbi:MAG: LptE family protein [Alistipes sp.]|nr:LptE family protein [Alistipes sp.]MBQ1200945.1 LptE family protein [Alistipes sp.]MBQ2419051.1 LptE family protein [Alistipes sp.]